MAIFVEDPLDMLNALMIFKDGKWQIDTVGDDFSSPRGKFGRIEDALNALVSSGATGDLASRFDGFLKVLLPELALGIATHPQDAHVAGGGDVVLSVEATGENLTYEWYESIDLDAVVDNPGGHAADDTTINMSGATSPSINIGNVVRSESDELLLATDVNRFLNSFDAERGYRETTAQPLSNGESIPFFEKIDGEDGKEITVSIVELTKLFVVVSDGEGFVVSQVATITV